MRAIEFIIEDTIEEGNFNITVRDAKRILTNLGYRYDRQRGDHEQWVKPGEGTFPLQVGHKNVPGRNAGHLLDLMKRHNYKLK